MITIGIVGIFIAYVGAFAVSRNSEWCEGKRQAIGDAFGVLFALALLTLVEALLHRFGGVSFVGLVMRGSTVPVAVFTAGACLGMAYEYIWQFGTRSWYYPSVEKRRVLLAALPLFWGIFMLIMQDTYALFRISGSGAVLAATATALVQGALIEGINFFTRSWVYVGKSASFLVLVPGWIVFLAFVFILLFNRFFVNPFGY